MEKVERGGQQQFCLSEGPADEAPPSRRLGVFEPGLGGSWVPGLELGCTLSKP